MRRILAIDGGGIKGVFPAAFLAQIEQEVEGNVGDYFDLICGTSTGGIIALALASGIPGREILEFYREHGAQIFSAPRRFLGRLFAPKYDPAALIEALEKSMGDRRIEDCRCRVVVPSMQLGTGEVYIYKTPHHPKLHADRAQRVVDVAAATCAAPTYFPAHRSQSGPLLVDGGTWANDPAGVAAVEAVGMLGWERESTRLLSLGCTTEPLAPRPARHGGGGRLAWARHGLDIFLAGQTSAAQGTARVLLGGENVHRVSPVVGNGSYHLDGAEAIDDLQGLAEAVARRESVRVREIFFREPAEPFRAHTS